METIYAAAPEILELIDAGRTDEAIERILAFKQSGKGTRYTLIRVLISTGQHRDDARLTRCALDAFERIKAKAPNDPELFYDIANGYQVLVESALHTAPGAGFDCEEEIKQAIRYFGKAGDHDPRAVTNLGNLYDTIGRPVEAIACYERALAVDPGFAMAAGNKAMALEVLAPISSYSTTYQIHAHQLYEAALGNEASLLEVGGEPALVHFRQRNEAIERRFTESGHAELLGQDLSHEPYDDGSLSEFVRFYVETCVRHDLYLNLHIVDRRAQASIGDRIAPVLHTGPAESDDQQYVQDIMFRLNEIIESYMTARLLFVRSQFTDDDSSAISEQTTLVNLLDYSVSNIYVGQLKASYKEAFSALDKVAVLINHYLGIGHSESSVYYGNVWYEPASLDTTDEPVLADAVRAGEYRLLGLYLLCRELSSSKYSHLRNALTHRYARVYRGVPGPKGTQTFEEMSSLTADLLYKIKCAIMYAALFIEHQERQKYPPSAAPTIQMPLYTDQNLDLW